MDIQKIYSALSISHGHFSSNNSRKTAITRPLGRDMGVCHELEIWPKFCLRNWAIVLQYCNIVLHCSATYWKSIVYDFCSFCLQYKLRLTPDFLIRKTDPTRSLTHVMWVRVQNAWKYKKLGFSISYRTWFANMKLNDNYSVVKLKHHLTTLCLNLLKYIRGKRMQPVTS